MATLPVEYLAAAIFVAGFYLLLFTILKMKSRNTNTSGKWRKYSKHYNYKWEMEDALKNWIAPTSEEDILNGKREAFCKICKLHLRAHHTDLIAHSKTERHRANEYALNKPRENILYNEDSTDPMNSIEIEVVSDEERIKNCTELLNMAGTKGELFEKIPTSKLGNHYNVKWELEPALKHWIAPSSLKDVLKGKREVFCKFCQVHIRAHHSDLITHSKRKKHKENERSLHLSDETSFKNDDIVEAAIDEAKIDVVEEEIDEANLDVVEEEFDEAHLDVIEEEIEGVITNNDSLDMVANELFSGEAPLLKRKRSNSELTNLVVYELSADTEQEKKDQAEVSSTHKLDETFQHEMTNGIPPINQCNATTSESCHTCGLSMCSWQELAKEKLLVVQEKREQQRIQHNMAEAEFDLRMEIMRKEHELKKRKLELEILSLNKTLT